MFSPIAAVVCEKGKAPQTLLLRRGYQWADGIPTRGREVNSNQRSTHDSETGFIPGTEAVRKHPSHTPLLRSFDSM